VFWTGLNDWHDLVTDGKSAAYNVRCCLYDFLDQCGVRIAADDAGLMVGIGIASQIIRSVEEIHRRRLEGQSRRSARGVIAEVYFAIVRNQEDFGESLPVNQDAEGVVLSTVHQAKGREWPVVILPMLNRRRFPVSNRAADNSYPHEIAGRYGTTTDDERRLFYVAVTRARERLFFIDTAATNASSRSQFLKDLQQRAAIAPTALPPPLNTVWTIAADDLVDDARPPIRIGLSDLLIFLECPYQFGLRRVAGIQPAVGDDLGFGKGLHELIQRRAESDHAWSEAELAAQVDTHVHLPLSSATVEQTSKNAIAKRIRELGAIGVFTGSLEQELQVEVVLGGGVVIGIIDYLYTAPDGSLVVRDWKASVHQKFVGRYGRQLQFYAHALRSQGRTVGNAELVDVKASVEAKQLVTIPVDVSEAAVAAVIAQCEQAIHLIQESMFHPTPSASVCGSCDVRRVCASREGGLGAETEG
jgi:DNA helicase-2/ATP-dependent DNA helicase PcrA